MANVSNYVPIDIVDDLHNVPHLNENFESTSNVFQPKEEYYISISTLPITLMVGSLAVLGIPLFVWMLVRICRRLRKKDDSHYQFSLTTLSLATILIIQTILVGVLIFGSSLSNGSEGIKALRDRATAVNNNIEEVSKKVSNINTIVTAPECRADADNPFVKSSFIILENLSGELNKTLSTVRSIPRTLNDVSSQIRLFGLTYAQAAFFVVYGLALVAVFLLIAGIQEASAFLLNMTLVFASVLVILFLMVGAAQFVSVILFADFCSNPEASTLSLINNEMTREVASYYFYCEDESVIQQEVKESRALVVSLNATIYRVLDEIADPPVSEACRNVIEGSSATTLLLQILSLGLDTIELVMCGYWNAIWREVILPSLCEDAFIGYFIIWLSVYIITVMFTVITTTASITMFAPAADRAAHSHMSAADYETHHTASNRSRRNSTAAADVIHPAPSSPPLEVDMIPLPQSSSSAAAVPSSTVK